MTSHRPAPYPSPYDVNPRQELTVNPRATTAEPGLRGRP